MGNGPYWKVPYSNKKSPEGHTMYATVEEVQAALPKDVQGLTVDADFNYPCVQFPEGTPYSVMLKVKKHLQDQGFEVS